MRATRLTDSGNQAFAYVVQGDDGSLMEVRGDTSRESVTVIMEGLDRLPTESSYQVWAINEGSWQSIGVCNTNDEGIWRGDFAFQLKPEEEVALTVEPRGGSPGPTTEPLLRTGN